MLEDFRQLEYRVNSLKKGDLEGLIFVKNRLTHFNNKYAESNRYVESIESIKTEDFKAPGEFGKNLERIITLIRGMIRDIELDGVLGKTAKELELLINEAKEKNEEIENIKKRLLFEEQKVDDLKKKIELTDKKINFNIVAESNVKRSRFWLVASFIILIVFIGLLFNWFGISNEFIKISTDALSKIGDKNEEVIKTTLLFEFIRILFLRILLTSISIYILVFCLKNYNVQMHNYAVNMHKSNSLQSAISLLETAKTEEGSDKLLLQATEAIFSHQNTGYNKDNIPSPSLITSVIENINPKSNK